MPGFRQTPFALLVASTTALAFALSCAKPPPPGGDDVLAKGQDPAQRLDTLEHAHAMLPSTLAIRAQLARAYVVLQGCETHRPGSGIRSECRLFAVGDEIVWNSDLPDAQSPDVPGAPESSASLSSR